ncbi:MAG: virulence factor MviN, partial [Silvibacterium sp.]
SMGPLGLAIASDIGILMQTLTLAILLNLRRMVPLSNLEYPELLRSLLAAVVSYAALVGLRHLFPTTSRLHELALLLVATIVWLAISAAVLRLTGSKLPDQLVGRFSKSSAA